MDPRLPARLDRATFDRVLQRAAELQAASKDIGEGLSEDEVLALGTEVGIPAQHLRQALLEERTRAIATAPESTLDRWIAPAEFAAQRVVQGSPEAVGGALTKWMERQEHLIVQRSAAGRITFEPMESFAGAMRKVAAMFDASRGKPYLDKAELVTAVITPLEAGFSHVSLAASLHKSRNSHVAGGTAAALSGGVVAGLLLLLGAPVILGLLPVVPTAIGGYAAARTFRGRAERAQLGLERALDELERRLALPGARPAAGLGQVVRSITQEVRKAFDE